MGIDREARGAQRANVRVFQLGHEPPDNLADSTTAEERLDILRALTERAWRLSGRAFPTYSRAEIPVRVTLLE